MRCYWLRWSLAVLSLIADLLICLTVDSSAVTAPPNPPLVKLPFAFPKGMENTPVVFQGRPLLVQNDRSFQPQETRAGPSIYR